MDATAKEILTSLKARKYAPVYVLQGEETYYIDMICSFIEEHVLEESERGFNQVVLYGKESPVATILTHARRYPMMAERQVVIVKEAQDIPDLSKDTGQKLLLDYFSKPVPSTLLLLCHKHKSLDKRKELGKKVEQLTVSATFKKTYDNQLPGFIEEYVRSKNQSIMPDAAAGLAEYVGNDLSRLANEIDKLLIGRMENLPITMEDVIRTVGISREFNVFELQKALVTQDVPRAFRIMNYFGSNTRKNPPIMMVAFLFNYFSRLLQASYNGSSEKEIANTLKISTFIAREYSAALRYYSRDRIMEVLTLLSEFDLRLKGVRSGSEEDAEILKELVIRILHTAP